MRPVSQGIGKAYAKALAKRGLNVVIISRNEERLKETASEIQAAAPKASVKTIAADFSKSVESGLYDNIKSEWHDQPRQSWTDGSYEAGQGPHGPHTAVQILRPSVQGSHLTLPVASTPFLLAASTSLAPAEGLEGLEVGILINNVGISYPGALFFHELEAHVPTLPRDMVHLNVDSVTQMTALVLPGMVARKRGAIVNIASAAGRIPIGNPLYAV